MVGRGDLYTRQPHTTDTHGWEEGRSNTPTTYLLVPLCTHFLIQVEIEVNQFKKQKHTCKKVMDTLPNLKHNKQSSPTTQTTTWKGGGGGLIAQHSGGVCAVLVVGLLPHPPHP